MSRKRKNNLEGKTSDNAVIASEPETKATSDNFEVRMVEVSGKTITVGKATFRTALNRERLRKEALRYMDDRVKSGKEVTPEEQAILAVFYPSMMACSTYKGDEFSYDAFMNLPEEEVNEWYLAVMELNPHWFPKDEELLAEEEIKKNNN